MRTIRIKTATGLLISLMVPATAACSTDVTGSAEYLDLAGERDSFAAEVEALETALGSANDELADARAALAEASTSPSGAAATAAIHPVPAEAAVVWGTAACDFGDGGTDPDGGPGMLIVCELDLNDPRVSGTETHDRLGYLAGRLWAGGVWVAGEATITNNEGMWRGVAQGAEDDAALPIGEAHYVGEGVYEGLEFHYYFYDSPDIEAVPIHGWISGGR